ncbi:TIGR03899 family protein [Shewanella sp. 4t3-1-2LB]|uniref:TIGR03899 family protein n=1 Tax=Shewanella sp. 4t3-1-2LB TaxID=2817682 RepID=UPI001A99DB3C|nr:TIGR03899 family protein [Shewanella sp. 4t3-1-2LB]MBO1270868.1 TIGR03899 family protein [Shewanella sp. 4t3-1-2LB]
MAENRQLNDAPQVENALDMSARKKVLRLGHLLGLASEQDYHPASATLGQRASFRLAQQQQQYQQNLENIYAMALSYSSSEVAGAELDPDWIHQFFQMAEQIHNRKMQDLWGRILASETVNPGNFSLRTLATLQQLTLREAQLMEKALGMTVKINNEQRGKLLGNYRVAGGLGQYFRKHSAVNLGLSQFGLPYSNLLTLMDAGLIHKSEFETGILPAKQAMTLQLNQQQLTITPKNNHLLFGYYRFTAIGEELAQLVPPRQDLAYVDALKTLLQQDFQVN